MGKTTSSHFLGCFWSDPFHTSGNEDMPKSLDEFEFRPDPDTDYGVSCPWASKTNQRHHVFSVTIDPILFKLAGNEDMHNALDEFEFRPQLTTDYGVSCPWASEKNPIDL